MIEYDSFGNQRNRIETDLDTDPNPFRYCGEYFDSESNTLYLRNRSYDARNGRFTQEDPVKSGLNWYTYCNSDPINYIDPWGLKETYLFNEDYITHYLLEDDGSIDPYALEAMYNHANGPEDFTPEAWEMILDLGLEGIFENTGGAKLDISEELDAALALIQEEIEALLKEIENNTADYTDEQKESLAKMQELLEWFVSKVNHGKEWDIKLLRIWLLTIKLPYPGQYGTVFYHGNLYTPEELGNYTYGYIGAALGLSLFTLYAGSFYAAGFPIKPADLANEFNDWESIKEGFYAYHNR